MGGGIRDNFVIVDVLNSGEVNFRLIHLNANQMFDLIPFAFPSMF